MSPSNVERELIKPAGPCRYCAQHVSERLVVAVQVSGTGPGNDYLACIPCARMLAPQHTAPAWLTTDLARLDQARGPQ